MSKIFFLLLFTLFFLTFHITSAVAKEFAAQGTVNAIKSSSKKLNISHGPVKGLMDGMTMDFKVADPAMLDDVDVGSKIEFILEEDRKGNLTIISIDVTGSTSKNVAGN